MRRLVYQTFVYMFIWSTGVFLIVDTSVHTTLVKDDHREWPNLSRVDWTIFPSRMGANGVLQCYSARRPDADGPGQSHAAAWCRPAPEEQPHGMPRTACFEEAPFDPDEHRKRSCE